MQSDGLFVYTVLTRVTPIGWLFDSTNATNAQKQFTQIKKIHFTSSATAYKLLAV